MIEINKIDGKYKNVAEKINQIYGFIKDPSSLYSGYTTQSKDGFSNLSDVLIKIQPITFSESVQLFGEPFKSKVANKITITVARYTAGSPIAVAGDVIAEFYLTDDALSNAIFNSNNSKGASPITLHSAFGRTLRPIRYQPNNQESQKANSDSFSEHISKYKKSLSLFMKEANGFSSKIKEGKATKADLALLFRWLKGSGSGSAQKDSITKRVDDLYKNLLALFANKNKKHGSVLSNKSAKIKSVVQSTSERLIFDLMVKKPHSELPNHTEHLSEQINFDMFSFSAGGGFNKEERFLIKEMLSVHHDYLKLIHCYSYILYIAKEFENLNLNSSSDNCWESHGVIEISRRSIAGDSVELDKFVSGQVYDGSTSFISLIISSANLTTKYSSENEEKLFPNSSLLELYISNSNFIPFLRSSTLNDYVPARLGLIANIEIPFKAIPTGMSTIVEESNTQLTKTAKPIKDTAIKLRSIIALEKGETVESTITEVQTLISDLYNAGNNVIDEMIDLSGEQIEKMDTEFKERVSESFNNAMDSLPQTTFDELKRITNFGG